MGNAVAFLGIHGVAPSPANDMAIALSLSPDRVRACADRIRQILGIGAITRQEIFFADLDLWPGWQINDGQVAW